MRYVIVTPAYNEESGIGRTIESVLRQTVLPDRWVIVDDGSTDGTAALVRKYAQQHPWIVLVSRERIPGHSYYASNVYAIAEGVGHLRDAEYDFLAILDADISLFPEYYELILRHFNEIPRLGICSGNCVDIINGREVRHLYDRRSCPKAIMVLRRRCYEDIGGFVPMQYGGEDTCACFAARMNGWLTWAYHEYMVIHNKPLGTGPATSMLRVRLRQGMGEYYLAAHPLFAILKAVRRTLKEKPLVIGGLFRLVGYLYACCRREPRQISEALARYIHREQLNRIMLLNGMPQEMCVYSPRGAGAKICLAASSGGHLTQLLRLSASWEGYETFSVTTSAVTRKQLERHGRVYVVGECNHRQPLRTLKVLFRCIRIIVRERPDFVLSSGAAAGCMVCYLGKLLGAKVIWIDSITNVERLSLSGRLVRHIADLFLVQWPELAKAESKTEYVHSAV